MMKSRSRHLNTSGQRGRCWFESDFVTICVSSLQDTEEDVQGTACGRTSPEPGLRGQYLCWLVHVCTTGVKVHRKLIWRAAPVQTLVQPPSSGLKHYLFVHLSPGMVGFLSDRCMPHASHFPTSLLHLPSRTLHTLWPLSKCFNRGGSVSVSLHILHNNFTAEYKSFLLPINPTPKETKQKQKNPPLPKQLNVLNPAAENERGRKGWKGKDSEDGLQWSYFCPV